MSQSAVDVPPKGGFSFDLCKRNDMLTQKGLKAPSFLKTGTTIVGLIFKVWFLFSHSFLCIDCNRLIVCCEMFSFTSHHGNCCVKMH